MSSASTEQILSLDGAMDHLQLSDCASSTEILSSSMEPSLPSSPGTELTLPPPVSGSPETGAQSAGEYDTVKSKSRVKIAKKRGVQHQRSERVSSDHDDMSSLAQKPEETAKTVKSSRELQGLFTGFGEAFMDGQRMVTERGRRSQRVKSGPAEQTAHDLTAGPENRPSALTSKPATVRSAASTKYDFEETTRAERRLADLYRQRAVALACLQPEERAALHPPRTSKANARYKTGLDCFGIPYTDLLADSTKHSVSSLMSDMSKTKRVFPSRIVGPKPKRLLSSSYVQAWYEGKEDRYCFCRGVEGNQEMVMCCNEQCAIGWYHVECVGEENMTEE
ncbi:inhibitor of growth protein 5-like [Teratosphaeria destructans]|uniref:Inhibitor of growth protein 5-like n=1 Tax=Teratosphaeria destructans TaxID=418781 RepID=A0A9W7SWZ5_9PEZI|nr:inhibitor of growth protein 5-like [Teratosphaeria destructans]